MLTSVTQSNNTSAERILLPLVCWSSGHTKQRPQRANGSQPPPVPGKVQQKPSNVQSGGARVPCHSLHPGPQDFNPILQTTSTSCHARGRKFPRVHLYKVRKKPSNSSKMKKKLISPVLQVRSCITSTEGHNILFSSPRHLFTPLHQELLSSFSPAYGSKMCLLHQVQHFQ